MKSTNVHSNHKLTIKFVSFYSIYIIVQGERSVSPPSLSLGYEALS